MQCQIYEYYTGGIMYNHHSSILTSINLHDVLLLIHVVLADQLFKFLHCFITSYSKLPKLDQKGGLHLDYTCGTFFSAQAD